MVPFSNRKDVFDKLCFPYSCLNVGRALVVGAGQHGDDTDQDGLDRVDGRPALTGLLVSVLVLTWGMLY